MKHQLALLGLATLSLFAQNYDVALIGDMPYGAAAEPKYLRVIAEVNKQPSVEFTAFIGDTKSGSTRCDNSHYTQALGWFNSFEKPLIYSVGDNEWTDCMRTNNGAYNPLDRLAVVRRTYFSTNMSLGRNPVPLKRQSDDPNFAAYVENTMLVKGPVVYVSIHMPGSNNNLEYKNNQGTPNAFYDNDREYTSRNAANLAWLKQAFQTAKDTNSFGVMILVQANIFETFMDTTVGNSKSGYSDFVTALRAEVKNFKGEVVMVSGDSHYMRVHKPLTEQYPACISATGDCKPFDAALDARGATLLNFTHVEVPGSTNVHWVLCHVRPGSRNLFNFEFMLVPDAAAVPASGVTAIVADAAGNAASSFDVNGSQFTLDASRSTSSAFGPLAYAWSAAPGFPSVGITRGDTAKPLFQLGNRGTYQLLLTVTDRLGNTANSTVAVRYN